VSTNAVPSKSLTLDLLETLYLCSVGLLSPKRVLEKNVGNKGSIRTFDLLTLFCSCFVQNSFKKAMDLARIGPKFPCGAKFEGYIVTMGPGYPHAATPMAESAN
jgi:hypothetical protein